MEQAVNNGENWETLIREWADRDIYSQIDYRKIFRPGDEDNGAGIKTQGIYRRTCIVDRTKADLQDR